MGKAASRSANCCRDLARCIDDICVLRSLHTDNPNHGPALFMMNNGTITPIRPSMGAWLSYGLGTENAEPARLRRPLSRPAGALRRTVDAAAFCRPSIRALYINHTDLDPQRMIPFLRNRTLSPRSPAPPARSDAAAQRGASRRARPGPGP